jgi:glycosyltransferase involved in cell wall biosynthesis
MAIGSTTADFVLERPERLVVNHHNLTPLRYFAGWEPVAAHGVVWGRQQLRRLATRAALGVAVSRYNDADLVDAGFERTVVVPFLLGHDALAPRADTGVVDHLRTTRTGTDWLFVGRIAPNKAQEDVVKAFAAYHRFFDPNARLHLVGGGLDSSYGYALQSFVHAIGLEEAVVFTGGVSRETLAAHYESADVLVVLSEHEGFCVPLLEAMQHGLPVVAYAAAAIPETLGDAGLLLDTNYPESVSTAVARVTGAAALRAHLVNAGSARVRDFALEKTGPAFVRALESA